MLASKRLCWLAFTTLLGVCSVNAEEARLQTTLHPPISLSPQHFVHPVECVAFSPNGKILFSATDNMVGLWDMATAKNTAILNAHVYIVCSVALSPDGQAMATGGVPNDGDNARIELWDLARKKNVSTIALQDQWAVESLAYSPDGKSLVSGMADGTVRLWDIASGKNVATLRGHKAVVFSVCFSPDGKFVASGSGDTTVKLWDVATGRNVETLKGHAGVVFSVIFSPLGGTIASGSDDRTIKLWQVANRKNVATLTGHSRTVYSVAFSPDGKTLASGSLDKTIKLWKIATGNNVASLDGHADGVCSVAFSPDGKTLASGSLDGDIKLWKVAGGNRNKGDHSTLLRSSSQECENDGEAECALCFANVPFVFHLRFFPVLLVSREAPMNRIYVLSVACLLLMQASAATAEGNKGDSHQI
jgi:WD40 repeat protein